MYAIKTDQSLWAWGSNGFRQLGDSSTTNRLAPVRIGTANNWLKIEASTLHAIALRTTGYLLPNVSSVFDVQAAGSMLLYPNPASDVLHFMFTHLAENATYSIYDFQGRQLVPFEMLSVEKTVNIAFLAKGVYLMRVQSGANTYWQRFLKQ